MPRYMDGASRPSNHSYSFRSFAKKSITRSLKQSRPIYSDACGARIIKASHLRSDSKSGAGDIQHDVSRTHEDCSRTATRGSWSPTLSTLTETATSTSNGPRCGSRPVALCDIRGILPRSLSHDFYEYYPPEDTSDLARCFSSLGNCIGATLNHMGIYANTFKQDYDRAYELEAHAKALDVTTSACYWLAEFYDQYRPPRRIASEDVFQPKAQENESVHSNSTSSSGTSFISTDLDLYPLETLRTTIKEKLLLTKHMAQSRSLDKHARYHLTKTELREVLSMSRLYAQSVVRNSMKMHLYRNAHQKHYSMWSFMPQSGWRLTKRFLAWHNTVAIDDLGDSMSYNSEHECNSRESCDSDRDIDHHPRVVCMDDPETWPRSAVKPFRWSIDIPGRPIPDMCLLPSHAHWILERLQLRESWLQRVRKHTSKVKLASLTKIQLRLIRLKIQQRTIRNLWLNSNEDDGSLSSWCRRHPSRRLWRLNVRFVKWGNTVPEEYFDSNQLLFGSSMLETRMEID